MMVLVGLIQMLDVMMDSIEGRWAIVPGVVVLGLLYLFGAARVSGAPFFFGAANPGFRLRVRN